MRERYFERKESARVKTRGQYDVAEARRGCRRVPTWRETGASGLSIKESAVGGDRTRILGVSHRRPVYREAMKVQDKRNRRKGRKGENGENKRSGTSCAVRPLWRTSSERERVVRGRCTPRKTRRSQRQQQREQEEEQEEEEAVKGEAVAKKRRETERKEFKREGAAMVLERLINYA